MTYLTDQIHASHQSSNHFSCPIKINKKIEIFGCGVLDTCCYPLNEPVPEFKHQIPSKNAVCSTDGEFIYL